MNESQFQQAACISAGLSSARWYPHITAAMSVNWYTPTDQPCSLLRRDMKALAFYGAAESFNYSVEVPKKMFATPDRRISAKCLKRLMIRCKAPTSRK